jgi:ferric-dicitrate binding protein FerR (iron transport regulator)
VADGLADEAMIAELEELMHEDSAARVTYLQVMQLHQDLERKAARGTLGATSVGFTEAADPGQALSAPRTIRFPRRIWMAVAGIVAVVIAGLALPGVRTWLFGDVPVATLTRLVQVDEPMTYHQGFHAGDRITFNTGFVELTYRNGARVVLQSPVDYTLEKAGYGRLELGSLVADVPPKATGFTVVTPSAEVKDIGTRFGVALLDTGRTEFEVFTGEVHARSAMAGDAFKSFKQGEAAAVGDGETAVENIAPNLKRFRAGKEALNQRTVEAVADCFVQGGEHADRVPIEENLLLKQLGANNQVARKVWIRFDVSGESVDHSRPATLTLHTAKDIKQGSWDIQIHGLIHGFVPAAGSQGFDWRESKMTWNNAPGNAIDSPVSLNSAGALITSGEIRVDPKTEPAGSYFTFTLPSLEPYLQSDGTVTLMVSTLTGRHQVLNLAAREHGSFAGPLLTFETRERNEK